MNRRALFVGLALLAPVLAVLTVSYKFNPRLIDSPLINQPAPEFALSDLDGRVFDLSELRGKPVVINFWATYCAPCIVEHPILTAASRHYRDRVHFLGIIYQDDPQLIDQFVRTRGSWGPSLIDEGGKAAIAYGVFGPPETFFIDSEGVIVEKVIGAVSAPLVQSVIESML